MDKDSTAPPLLEPIRTFINSLDVERPEADPLANAEGARAWLEAAGFAVGPLTEEDAREIRALREALRRELLSHTGDCGCDETQTWPVLATHLAGTGLELVFDSPGRVRLASRAAAGVAAVRGAIASRVYDAVRSGEWRRLKACRKSTCQFAFYDRSKNGSGTWCDMSICGNRVKAQRRRDRTRSQVRP